MSKERKEDDKRVKEISDNVCHSQVRIWSKADKPPSFAIKINVTSRSDEEWSKAFSPFFLGPVDVWPTKDTRVQAQVFENAWQYLKVYQYTDSTTGRPHIDPQTGEPTDDWMQWATAGWQNPKARRCPMGRGAKPEYALWKGEHKLYVASRFSTYAPLYATLVEQHCQQQLQRIRDLLVQGKTVALFDFDGYDHVYNQHDFQTVIYNNHMRMGHGFVLAMLLLGERVWETPYNAELEHSTRVKRNHNGAARMGPLEFFEAKNSAALGSEKLTSFCERMPVKLQNVILEVIQNSESIAAGFERDTSPQPTAERIKTAVLNALGLTESDDAYENVVDTVKKYVGFKYGRWLARDQKDTAPEDAEEEYGAV